MAEVFFENANETATLTNTFKVGSTATDPTTVSLTVTDPALTQTTYTYAAAEITRTSAGVYTKNIACSQDGVWVYLWVGTGTVPDAQAGAWTVLPADLERYYCTLDDLKTRVGEPLTETRHDFRLLSTLAEITTDIDKHCDRVFRRRSAATARVYQPKNRYEVDTADFWTTTDLVVQTDDDDDGTYETTWTLTTDYELHPADGVVDGEEGWPFWRIRAVGGKTFPVWNRRRRNPVQVTAKWGWQTLPAPVKEAALILGEASFKLADTPFGQTGGQGQFGIIRARENPFASQKLFRYQRYPVKVG